MEQAIDRTQSETQDTHVRHLSFLGTGGSLFGIYIVNILLSLVTLGIYYFWGKVRVRQYLSSQTDFAGDRFAYHGTGKELLIGFLKAVLIFGVPFVLLQLVQEVPSIPVVLQALAIFLTYVLFFVFSAVATVGARRYRFSRTSWRGIRFSFRGQVMELIKLFVKGSLLSAITFGLYYPVFEVHRYRFLVQNSYFGSQAFSFTGENHALLGSYLKVYVLSLLWIPLVVGAAYLTSLMPLLFLLPVVPFIVGLWFVAKKQRYFWEHTSCANVHFHSTVTGKGYLFLMLGNLLLLLVSLGLAWPWTIVRNIQFAFTHLHVTGPLELATVQQDAQDSSATGEGLSSFLDVGIDIEG